MLQPQDSRFWRVALQTGLIDESSLRACWDGIPPERRTPDAIDRRLARRAVEAGHFTRWQAQQLLAGIRPQGLLYNKYVIRDVIGQGGMGRVYLAHDRKLDRRVALKVLSRERMNNPRALTRFRREARVGAQLQHDNLVRIYDAGEEEGNLFLVMEYIEGKNVGKLLADRGPLSAPVATRIARQVALGLEHARIKGLVHRDVNPMNILLDRDGTAKLTDLGLAIDLGEQGQAVTRDGATVGTFDYISPEQARHSRSIDIRSDIYSLGCTLYQMLSGRVPYPQSSLPEKLYMHQMVDPDPLENLVAGIPEGLSAIVRRMMAKLPEDRYPTPLEVARALEPYQCGPVGLEEIESSPEVPIFIESDGDEPVVHDELASDGPIVPLAVGPGSPDPARMVPEPVDAGLAHPDALGAFPQIDTGPEPRLTDAFPENRSGVARPPRPPKQRTNGRNPLAWITLAAGACLAAVMGWAFWTASFGGMPTDSDTAVEPKVPGLRDSSTKPGPRPKPSPPNAPALVVRWLDDQSEEPAPTLREAVNRAVNKNAEVILRNIEPLVLDPDVSIPINGPLVIRSAEGVRSILAVTRGRSRPLFQINPNAMVHLSGLTLRLDTGGKGSLPSALIEAHGELEMENCAATITGPDRSPRVVETDGRYTTISNCQFAGFDTPLMIKALAGSRHRLENCLIVRDRPADASPQQGWAVSVERTTLGGGTEPLSIGLDRCTIVGLGLLALGGLDAGAEAQVQATGTVVQAGALLMWSGPAKFPEGLNWQARDNWYAIATKGPWVMAGPDADTDTVATAPGNLDTWTKVVGAEPGTMAKAVKFIASGTTSPELRSPADFVLIGEGSERYGIDPMKVGP